MTSDSDLWFLMGWLLISNKKKKTGRRSAKAKVAHAWDPRTTLRVLTTVTWAVIMGAVVLGWPWAQRRLMQSVSRLHHESPEIVLHSVPTWLPDSEGRKLFASLRGEVDGDPFDRTSLVRAQETLQDNPWVRRVDRVERLPGGRVEVTADYREPAAMVAVGEKCHLIDSDAVELPLVYPLSTAAKLHMPVITGVVAGPPGAGEAWAGADVRAGLKLAAVVRGQSWAHAVRAIDVSNYANRRSRTEPQLVLKTRDGEVRWGRPPGEEKFFEPPAAQKLRNIEAVIRKSPTHTIDAGGQTVDVYGDTVLIHPAAEVDDIRYTLGQ